ncbi:MAG: hypothetical protein RL420_658 [Pseudomonadota bacterium]
MGPLLEGLTDAIGFIAGALLGYGLGVALGLNLFAEGYGTGSVIAMLLVGLGGGMGLQAARYSRDRQKQSPNAD